MFRISENKRKYSPTPIVRVVDNKEEIILISTLKKKEGDELSERIVKLLNSKK